MSYSLPSNILIFWSSLELSSILVDGFSIVEVVQILKRRTVLKVRFIYENHRRLNTVWLRFVEDQVVQLTQDKPCTFCNKQSEETFKSDDDETSNNTASESNQLSCPQIRNRRKGILYNFFNCIVRHVFHLEWKS